MGFGARCISSPDHVGPGCRFRELRGQLSAGGATAQISYGRYHRAPWGDASRFLPSPGFQVFAERGAAWLEMPEKIQWSSPAGTKEERLALEPTVGDVLNDQFHRLVRGDHSLAPTIREALEIARLVNELRRSPARASGARRATPREGWPSWGWSPNALNSSPGRDGHRLLGLGLAHRARRSGRAGAVDRYDLQEFSDLR